MSDLLRLSDFESMHGAARATWMFTPCAYGVNTLAKHLHRQDHEGLARTVNCMEYFLKPIDCAIQALAAPIFSAIHYFTMIVNDYKEGNKVWVFLAVITPIGLPCLAAYHTFEIWCQLFADVIGSALYPNKIIESIRDKNVYFCTTKMSIPLKRYQIFFESRKVVRDPEYPELNYAIFMETRKKIIELNDEMKAQKVDN